MRLQIVYISAGAATLMIFVSFPILRSTPLGSAAWLIALGCISISVAVLILTFVLSLKWRHDKNRFSAFSEGGVFVLSQFFFRSLLLRDPNAWLTNLRPVFFIPTVFVLLGLCSLGTVMLLRLLRRPAILAFFWAEGDAFDKQTGKQYLHAFLVLFSGLFVISVAGPVLVASGGNMHLDMWLLLSVSLACALLSLCLATAIFFLRENYKYLEAALTAFLLLCILNAFIIPFQADILDGGELGGLVDDIIPMFRSIFLFIAIYLTAAKFRKSLRFVALPLLIFSFALTIFNWQSSRRADSLWYEDREAVITSAATFSNERNVVVIVLDMLQGTIADYVFERYPHLLASFDGFTLFTRAFTSFPFTRFSRETIQTGTIYALESNAPFTQEENALASVSNSFISDMYQAGARLAGFNIDLFGKFPAVRDFNEVLSPLRKYGYAFSASVARLTGYWISNPFGGHALGFVMEDSFNSVAAHNTLLERFNVDGTGDKLLYFWDYSIHTPVVFKRDGTIRSEPAAGDDVEALLDEFYFGLRQMLRLFETMDAANVYDNSLIIIVSDHGHGFGARAPLYLGSFTDGAYDKGNFLGLFRYSSSLFVKPPNARGTAQISHDPAWVGDVRALINIYLENFENIRPVDVMAEIRAAEPEVGVLFGPAGISMPEMWNSNMHHEIVMTRSLYEIAGAFLSRGRN